jgi:hypothetical protein
MTEFHVHMLLYGVAVIAIAIAAEIAIACQRLRRKAKSAMRWPTVNGTIVSSTVESHFDSDGDTMYGASVRYKYQIGRNEYESDRLEWGTHVSTNRPQQAEAIVKKYPPGRAVKVYYDPANPAVAVLEPGSMRAVRIMAFVALIFAVVGVIFLVFAVVAH